MNTFDAIFASIRERLGLGPLETIRIRVFSLLHPPQRTLQINSIVL